MIELVRSRVVVLIALLSAAAHAKETFRVAIAPPDGTSYARELRGWAHELEQTTHDSLAVRFYMGGIAGDEVEVGRRMLRGQVDATASAGMLCQAVMPSFRVLRMLGLFADRAEVDYAIGRLSPRLAEEAAKAGYVYLGAASMGRTVVFSKLPVATFDDLERVRLWRWNLDDVVLKMGKHMGLRQVPTPLDEATRAFDQNIVDGYWSVPVAALAFGFHAHARYVLDMSVDYLAGCMLVSERSFNKLSIDNQQAMRAASAKLAARIGSVGWKEDDALLGGVFAKHGMVVRVMPPLQRSAFLAAARDARDRLGTQLVPAELLTQIMTLLADYRVEHKTQ
jgi:TRAP-type C4-dicarboxylate transport system substrate-binding protein